MKKRKKHVQNGEPQITTKAVTPIRLDSTNQGKLVALDQLAQVFLALAQPYVALFCADEPPNVFHAPCFSTPLSEHWHRVAIQQAAGIAKSWCANLNKGKPLLVPIPFSDYHKKQLTDPETGKRRAINSSATLNKRDGAWWLTLTHDEAIAVQTPPDAPVIGIDIGIANFLTISDGQTYGTFNGQLRDRQKRDLENAAGRPNLEVAWKRRGCRRTSFLLHPVPPESDSSAMYGKRSTGPSISACENTRDVNVRMSNFWLLPYVLKQEL